MLEVVETGVVCVVKVVKNNTKKLYSAMLPWLQRQIRVWGYC